ncbi:MAG: hypothetical protein AAF580_13045 [Pseudomonadota bacterium]
MRSLFNDWVGARLGRSAFLLATIALLPFTILMAVIASNVSDRLTLADVYSVPVPWDMVAIAGLLAIPVHLAELNIAAKRALDIGLPPVASAVAKVAGPALLAGAGFQGLASFTGLAAFLALVLLPTNMARRGVS